MHLCYLILAHTDPPQLARLIKALDGGHASFYIHVDSKCALDAFTSLVKPAANVHFLSQRVAVTWGAFSVVEATLLLIRAALGTRLGFDYAVLLSGLDYPIKPKSHLLDFFARQPGHQYLRYVSIVDTPDLAYKIRYYHFMDLPWWQRQTITVKLRRRLLRGLLPARSFLPNLIPYMGDQWWALTRDCLECIIRFIGEHGEYVDFYRYTHVPDEMFFHTIVLNSIFGQRTNQTVQTGRWRNLSRPVREAGDHIKYVDRNSARESPAILNAGDFNALRKSDRLFARKFSSEKSLNLLMKIDAEMLCSASGLVSTAI